MRLELKFSSARASSIVI